MPRIAALLLCLAAIAAVEHPVLLSPKDAASKLAAGGSDWTTLKATCDAGLNQLVTPDYAGWGWRGALEQYALAYQVAVLRGDSALATQYGRKALAMMKCLARNHNYGSPDNAAMVGVGDGTTRTFTLPFAPASTAAVVAMTLPIITLPVTYGGATASLSSWGPIIAIADTANGPAAYPATDWRFSYRDGGDPWILRWLGSHHPASGATYYVRLTAADNSGTTTVTVSSASTTTVTLAAAPAAGTAVFVRYLGVNYEQTGNGIGGVNSVQPDGPGYQMRTFGVGLAYGYDLLHDFAELTPALKTEFYGILNGELDWYTNYGYERDGDIGNYFIRGLLMTCLYTGWGTIDENPRGQAWKDLGATLLQRTYDGVATKIPGGYGPQGQYAMGTSTDCLQLFTIWKNLTSEDRLATLAWTDNVIPANIHGTRPDRRTFYDGGDWSNAIPPDAPFSIAQDFITYQPNHPMTPYARQWLADGSQTVPSGTRSDYKADFPLSFCAPVSGPLYARSDWTTAALWLSFQAGPMVVDHQHRDQGHIELQRGSDWLLVDGGGYGYSDTTYHNSLLVDDSSSGALITYPPNQGGWGYTVGIGRHQDANGAVYVQADIANAYVHQYGEVGAPNAVTAAVRSAVFLRPDILIVHDAVQVANAATSVWANWVFPADPVQTGNVFRTTAGSSALFMRALLPAALAPTSTTMTYDGRTSYGRRMASATGSTRRAFLHLFEATPASTSTMRSGALVTATGGAEGVEFPAGGGNRVVLFATAGAVLPAGSVTYAYATGGTQRHIITDLPASAPCRITVTVGGTTAYTTTGTTSSAGVYDAAFSASAGQVVLSFGPDTTPPTISGIAVTGVTTSGATVDWSTDESSTGRVEYGTTASYGSSSATVATLATTHGIALTGLSAGTVYHYRVISVDASGNAAVSPDHTFTTASPGNTAPVISAISASATTAVGTTVDVSVTASDDGGEAALTYTWSAAPDAAFSVNGTNAAKHATVTFPARGDYSLLVVVADAYGVSTSRSLPVTVAGTPTTLTISPATATIVPEGVAIFTATVRDQFGAVIGSNLPSTSWSIQLGGIGGMVAGGTYIAPLGTATGSATVRATDGSASGTAVVTLSPSGSGLGSGGGSGSSGGGGSGGGCGGGLTALLGALVLGLASRRRRG